jgi:hypothetical protein
LLEAPVLIYPSGAVPPGASRRLVDGRGPTVSDRVAGERGDFMSSSASNLSDPRYGYDLVCATTQSMINATMRKYLQGCSGQTIAACYTRDRTTHRPVETPLQTIIDAIGGDPFSIPDLADETHPMVRALMNKCLFLFGFRAKMGLPSGVAPEALPPIVVFDQGAGDTVSYRLYCAEFSYLNLENNWGDITFRNVSQDPADPWTFLYQVRLCFLTGYHLEQLPPSLRDRLKNLDPNSMFSADQLYLDLNTKLWQSYPSITNLANTTDAYRNLTRSFIDAYWANLGDGVGLGYAVKAARTSNTVSSVVPTDLDFEISPHLDSSGKPSGQFDLYTLNYLVASANRCVPPPVPFRWNWVDATEEADQHGAMAIRRDIFLAFLQDLVNREVSRLCVSPTVTLTHSGDNYETNYSYRLSGSPTKFEVGIGQPDASGSTNVMSFSYAESSHDDSEAADHFSSIHGDFNYNITGRVSLRSTTISIELHATAYFQWNIHETGVRHGIVDGNGLDITRTVTYTLGVTQDGVLTVTEAASQQGGAQSLNYGSHGLVDTDNIRDYVTNVSNQLASTVASLMTGYDNDLFEMINHSHAWIFPGGKTFVYKDVRFSDALDLVAGIIYADPT